MLRIFFRVLANLLIIFWVLKRFKKFKIDRGLDIEQDLSINFLMLFERKLTSVLWSLEIYIIWKRRLWLEKIIFLRQIKIKKTPNFLKQLNFFFHILVDLNVTFQGHSFLQIIQNMYRYTTTSWIFIFSRESKHEFVLWCGQCLV